MPSENSCHVMYLFAAQSFWNLQKQNMQYHLRIYAWLLILFVREYTLSIHVATKNHLSVCVCVCKFVLSSESECRVSNV